ncbi:Nitric oxide synthase-interacting protein, partial [Teratosphaeria destructans]
KEAARREADDAAEQVLADAEASAKAVEEFEKVQAGLAAAEGAPAGAGVKRKYDDGEDDVLRLAKEGMGGKNRKVHAGGGGGDEGAAGRSELAAFWKAELKAVRPQPVCPAAAADSPHEFTLKTLVTVHFAPDTTTTTDDDPDTLVRSCPSCHKALSNSTKAVLAKPCGHVLCKPCSDQFQTAPAKSAHVAEHDGTVRCYVCQEDVTPGRKVKRGQEGVAGGKEKEGKGVRGLVELSADGTGFAGGGKNMVKKHGVAFQC